MHNFVEKLCTRRTGTQLIGEIRRHASRIASDKYWKGSRRHWWSRISTGEWKDLTSREQVREVEETSWRARFTNEQNTITDPDIPFEELVEKMPVYVKDNCVALAREFRDRNDNPFTTHNFTVEESLIGLRHHEVRVELDFDHPDKFFDWKIGCDSERDEGYSTCEFVPTENGTALFRGRLCNEVPKDGKVEGTGWAYIKSMHSKAFNRRFYFKDWDHFTHLLIKCRGDGRMYRVSAYTPLHLDLFWGDRYSYPLFTHGGPYWQLAMIPFSKLILNVGGRMQDDQDTLSKQDISSIGIAIMDRIEGDFHLEIDWIGAYCDAWHRELNSYEVTEKPVPMMGI